MATTEKITMLQKIWDFYEGYKTHYLSMIGGTVTTVEILMHATPEQIAATIVSWVALVIMAIRSAMKSERRNLVIAISRQLAEEVSIILADTKTPEAAAKQVVEQVQTVEAIPLDKIEAALQVFKQSLTQ